MKSRITHGSKDLIGKNSKTLQYHFLSDLKKRKILTQKILTKNGETKILIKCEKTNYYFDEIQFRHCLMTTILILISQNRLKKYFKRRWKICKNSIKNPRLQLKPVPRLLNSLKTDLITYLTN